MNNLLCFLFVIVLCVGLGNTINLPWQNSVHFKNALKLGNVLYIVCLKNGDSLGNHYINNGETYRFRFYDSIFKTKVDCSISQGGYLKYHREFRAYKGFGNFGKKNFWEAREDGIYFTHGKEIPKLEYKWIPYIKT